MEVELLTNATIVDDAIRFVALYADPIEKGNSDEMAVDNGALGHHKQQPIVTTNIVF